MVKPNHKNAKNAILLIQIVLLLDICQLIFYSFQYFVIQDLLMGYDVSETILERTDLLETISVISYFLVEITSLIFFIYWFQRAYSNLHQRLTGLNYGKNWATYSWFVPILNFYRPYQIMKELYFQSYELLINKKPNYEGGYYIKLLSWWWFARMVYYIFFRIYKNFTVTETLEDFESLNKLNIIAIFITIPMAIITIKVIQNYSNIETQLYIAEMEEEQNKENEIYQDEVESQSENNS